MATTLKGCKPDDLPVFNQTLIAQLSRTAA
jgi:hypothetical protein